MVDRQLRGYVQRQRDAGYTDGQVRSALKSQGYAAKDIDEALSPPKHHFWVMVAVILFVVVGVLAFFLIQQPRVPDQLLDIETEAATPDVFAGSDLSFSIDLINLGNERRYDVFLTHTVLNDLGQEVASKEESIAIETRASKMTSIPLPSRLAPGTYRLRTVAKFDGSQADASFAFAIKEPQVQTGFVIPVSKPAPEQLEPALRPTQLDEIHALAKTNLPLALDLCAEKFEELEQQDGCYLEIALTLDASDVCDRISDGDKKDTCYVNIALDKNDFSLCNRIQDDTLRGGCLSLG